MAITIIIIIIIVLIFAAGFIVLQQVQQLTEEDLVRDAQTKERQQFIDAHQDMPPDVCADFWDKYN